MTRHRTLPALEIIEVYFDAIGKYMKIKGQFEDGEIMLRWGIDQRTFRNIRSVIEAKHFDDMPGVKYNFRLLRGYSFRVDDNGQKIYIARVECYYNRSYKEIEFDCSELFAGNLQWFSTIKSAEEMKHMDWNSF